jgi:homoserine O-acetyltransferase
MTGTTSRTTPGFNGDTAKALGAIKAKTLVLTGTRICSTRIEPIEASKNITAPRS